MGYIVRSVKTKEATTSRKLMYDKHLEHKYEMFDQVNTYIRKDRWVLYHATIMSFCALSAFGNMNDLSVHGCRFKLTIIYVVRKRTSFVSVTENKMDQFKTMENKES